jgi:signal transduction histidine kinase
MRSLTETEVELGALINQVTDKLDSFRQEREVNVVVSGDIRTCIMGDEGFLVFLAESLLHNAIRFSFPGNEVRVNICSQNKKAVLTVTNSGPGIKSAYLPYVFQAFVPQDINHHSTGHGLSLAVCKEIIRAHHGLVEVESTPGKTTCFSVTLPALANTPTDISDQRPAVCQLTG